MKRAIVITFGLAVLMGVYLAAIAGWPVVVIGLLSIAFGILYTGGPFPLGYHGLGEIFVFVFFGLVAVAGTYYVQALRVTLPVVLAAVAPGLFSVAILAVNNLRDIDSDRRSGKRTLAVRFGRVFARAEYVLAVAVAPLVPVVLLTHRPKPVALAATICLALAARPILHVCRSTDGPTLNGVLAATGQNLLAYSLLFALGWLL
jgi:1,4-dihydroxy-2-naphthoate octaprenyltransferase